MAWAEQFKSHQEGVDWQLSRLGMMTGSKFGTLVARQAGGGYALSGSKKAEQYIYQIAWERLIRDTQGVDGLSRVDVSSRETAHGSAWESEAIERYRKQCEHPIDSVQRFVRHDEWIGGTPDGYIGEDGIIEVKCPFNGAYHLRTLLDGYIKPEYHYQIQGYLWITDRLYCDFVSFDPHLSEGMNLAVVKIERDQDMIDGIKAVMEEVVEKIKELLKKWEEHGPDGKEKR